VGRPVAAPDRLTSRRTARRSRTLVAGLVLLLVAAGCTSAEDEPASDVASQEPSPSATTGSVETSPSPSPEGTTTADSPGSPTSSGDVAARDQDSAEDLPVEYAVSVPGLARQVHRGNRLRLGAVRERTAAYTSYDASYRSRTIHPDGRTETYRITGVINVPTGRGPFPAVVLAHGYIDPAVYVRGQGMTRERGFLASRGYVALHVDYRNHAGSDDDPRFQARMRLGYSADVINAVKALRKNDRIDVDPDRVGWFGRSMGGGVVLKALVAEPGLVQAASAWASVSSLEAQNFNQFIRPDAEDDALTRRLRQRYGLPEENRAFWRANSSRPYLDRITEPVLLVHGRYDDTCPPRWASATQRALQRAEVSSQLAWYPDGHAFGPSFNAAMNRTVRFFDNRMG
jgi:dipeptidyl aminopeptidase/acylaminoacyl peptidase